jgi:hypothetical protein
MISTTHSFTICSRDSKALKLNSSTCMLSLYDDMSLQPLLCDFVVSEKQVYAAERVFWLLQLQPFLKSSLWQKVPMKCGDISKYPSLH